MGGNNVSECQSTPPARDCGEAALDIQVLTALAQGADTTFWAVPSGQGFVQWLNAVLSDPNPPLVHSLSYGEAEDVEYTSYYDWLNMNFAKLGSLGLTIVVSSGDSGVCADGVSYVNVTQCGAFVPGFPSTSPYVTSVGATMGPENGLDEMACSSEFLASAITTGGGFSNIFPMPTFQRAAAVQYLTNNSALLPPSALFNATGRGFPDIAFLGNQFPVIVNGGMEVLDGTSASTSSVTPARADRLFSPYTGTSISIFSLRRCTVVRCNRHVGE